ncbi:hypothetical protein GCM10007207_15550 [Asaia siamensis]|uniref:Uncharacterized protein n=1 Tax=Asaia siamensis TaxID=110479 RepID=A0ABQ1LWE5_9PROT|nr:hypothetical protein AA0323_0087 [Asaia siamensis NRIC 0323]GGC30926.1 hypothetical protein GCM10007207_15550 [Asaia siamensis]
MPGIGKKRERMGQEPPDRFGNDIGDVQRDADQKGHAIAGRLVNMPVPIPVVMAMMMPGMIVMVMSVVVIMRTALMGRVRIMTRMMGMVAGRFGHGALSVNLAKPLLYGISMAQANMNHAGLWLST